MVNRKMMGKNVDHTIYVDPSTGDLPYIATTEGVFQYDLPATFRKLADLFIPASYGYEAYDSCGSFEDAEWSGVQYYRVPVIARPKQNISTLANFTFRSDPGTTTEKYQYKAWKEPTRIANINVQIDVPEDFHDLVVDGVVAWARKQQYGDGADWLNWLNTRLPEEFWHEVNYNPPQTHYIQRRYC